MIKPPPGLPTGGKMLTGNFSPLEIKKGVNE